MAWWRVLEKLYCRVWCFAGFWSSPFTQDLTSNGIGCTERKCLGGEIWWRNNGRGHVATVWMLSACPTTSERLDSGEPFWGKLKPSTLSGWAIPCFWLLFWGIPRAAFAKECSKGSREMWPTLTERRICVFGAFVVVATSSDTIVVVSGLGAVSGNWGRHRLLRYKGQMKPEENWGLDFGFDSSCADEWTAKIIVIVYMSKKKR